jgi:DNA-binding transcriptional MocR family regulator
MDIEIDRESSIPLYAQIERQIREMIFSGALPAGFMLPPERRLAQALGVNRTTILNAYRELKADGLVDAHVGRGTIVQPMPISQREPVVPEEIPWRQIFRESSPGSQDPLIRDLLELTERRDVISLSIGLPSPEMLPMDQFKELTDELVDEVGAPLLLHCPTEGHTPLRETLSSWLASRGILCTPSEVLILSGSQQGLDLAARVFIEPGDTIVVEEPSYIGALQVFRNARARMIGVPTDEQGMRTDILEMLLERHRPKFIYTLPTFQNPSGVVLSAERRRHLLELAYRHRVPILEDDTYSELRYEGEPLPSLKAMDRHGFVLYLGTFSKVLFPGLRIGWLVAPRQVARQFTLQKQAVDLHSNSIGQFVLDRFIKHGYFESHLKKVRIAYAAKRDAMLEALSSGESYGMSWARPVGGFYVWCRLPDGIDRSRLLAHAVDAGVSFLPGWSCFVDFPGTLHLRLNFSYSNVKQITEGISRLKTAVKLSASRPRARVLEEVGTPPVV